MAGIDFSGATIGGDVNTGNTENTTIGDNPSYFAIGDHAKITHISGKRKDTEQPQAEKKEGYSMTKSPIGHCLIISNKKFENIKEVRKGTEHDAEILEETFEWLNFTVDSVQNYKADDIKQKVKKYSAEIHKSFDCFVCCILSHGDSNGILGTDGMHVSVGDLEKTFHTCETLVGKPKLFFIQACRGESEDKGIMFQADAGEGLPSPPESPAYQRQISTEPDFSKLLRVPETADFAVTYATPPGYKAWRDTRSGSWFISILCEVLQECASDQDLIGMLTEVRSKLSEKVGPKFQLQCCETVDRLTKKLYFNPSEPFNSNEESD